MLANNNSYTIKNIVIGVLVTFIALAFPHKQAKTQTTYTIITPLSFGTFAIRANDDAYDLSVDENNNPSNDTPFVVSSSEPQRGEIFLEGLPAETEVTLVFDDGSMTRSGGPGTPAFTITDFVTNQPTPLPFETNASGELTVLFGATLRTSGTSQAYQSGTYNGSFDLTISF